ncbi:MAG: hypothetical protein ACE5JX_22220, partial [Acidobacteriota bacterium]
MTLPTEIEPLSSKAPPQTVERCSDIAVALNPTGPVPVVSRFDNYRGRLPFSGPTGPAPVVPGFDFD